MWTIIDVLDFVSVLVTPTTCTFQTCNGYLVLYPLSRSSVVSVRNNRVKLVVGRTISVCATCSNQVPITFSHFPWLRSLRLHLALSIWAWVSNIAWFTTACHGSLGFSGLNTHRFRSNHRTRVTHPRIVVQICYNSMPCHDCSDIPTVIEAWCQSTDSDFALRHASKSGVQMVPA